MKDPVLVSTPVTVEKNDDHDRFELWTGEPERTFVGFLAYTMLPSGVYDLQHTIIKEEFGRQGFARTLVTHVLEALRAEGHTILPTCSYIQRYLERFPQYADLVASDAGRPTDS